VLVALTFVVVSEQARSGLLSLNPAGAANVLREEVLPHRFSLGECFAAFGSLKRIGLAVQRYLAGRGLRLFYFRARQPIAEKFFRGSC